MIYTPKAKKMISGPVSGQFGHLNGTFQMGTFDLECPSLSGDLLNPLGKDLKALQEIHEKPKNPP
jgi:hypothetical protein